MAEDEKTCPKCAESIKAAAVVCRFCGHNFTNGNVVGARLVPPARPKPSTGMRDLAIAALIVVGIGAAAIVGQKPAETSTPMALVGNSAAAPAATAVTAIALAKAYDDNEAAAQRDYSGRLLDVTGQVESIMLDASDVPSVTLEVPGTILGVHVELATGAESAAADLKKGQMLTVRCNDVSEIMGAPRLKQCVL